MPLGSRLRFAVARITCAAALLVSPGAVLANPRVDALLAELPFSAAERRTIMVGDLVTTASRETTSDRELVITMAFLVRKPPTNLVEMFSKATGYDVDAKATAYGELTGVGDVAQLQALRLTPNGDAEAPRYASASPGDDLNLSAAEIAALRALPDTSTAAVEAELRKLLLARYRAYRADGLAGIAPYDRGKGKSSAPATVLRDATKASRSRPSAGRSWEGRSDRSTTRSARKQGSDARG